MHANRITTVFCKTMNYRLKLLTPPLLYAARGHGSLCPPSTIRDCNKHHLRRNTTNPNITTYKTDIRNRQNCWRLSLKQLVWQNYGINIKKQTLNNFSIDDDVVLITLQETLLNYKRRKKKLKEEEEFQKLIWTKLK